MPGFVEHCNRIVRWGLLALIVFTPVAFGTVEDWSIAIMEWGVVTLFLIFMAGRFWPGDGPRRRGIGRTGLEWIFALFLLFCVAQTVPIPHALLSAISPGSARLYGTPIPSYVGEDGAIALPPSGEAKSDPGGADPSDVNRPVSLQPGKTLQNTRLTGVFMLLFLLSAWWADRRERVIYIVTAVTTVGFLVALQALLQYLTWNGRILWFRPASDDRGFGPFVNRNHFAGYVEMIIPLAIGLSLYLLERWRHSPTTNTGQEGSAIVSGRDGMLGGYREKAFLALFAVVILLVSLFFSMSRGGLLSALVSGFVLLALLWKRMPSRRIAWTTILCLPLLVMALIFWIGPEAVFEQIVSYDGFTNEASYRSRALVWRAMVENVREFVWVGTGLGTFEEGFAPFTPPGASSRWHRAHNDYLQLIWETGVVGLGLLLIAASIFARRFWWPSIRERGHPLTAIRIGAAVSVMSIAVHSLVDFNLQVGSNGFLFALVAGILVGLNLTARGEASDHSQVPAATESP